MRSVFACKSCFTKRLRLQAAASSSPGSSDSSAGATCSGVRRASAPRPAIARPEAPDHLRGRVLSLYYYAWNGLAPVGGVIVGWLCATGGTELAFVVAGVSGLAMAGLGALALRVPERVEPAEESEEPGEELAAA